jgi:hypothetical protein
VLSHFIEEEGVPTAGISLIRPQTEAIKPPRALWVPFDLGHPLGAPNNIPFQRRVLTDLINLLEAPEGPVLADFPDDEPESEGELTVLACPVDFTQETDESGETDQLQAAFHREMAGMRPWYDMAVDKRQRTTVGVSGIGIDGLGDFIYSFIQGVEPENPRDDVTLPFTLKLAAEDLKAFYNEGITAQPGQEGISSKAVKDWFWNDTVAGEVLVKLVDVCKKSPDKDMSNVAAHYLVPLDVMFGKK